MDSPQRAFDKELGDLKSKLVHMAGLAERMIDQAIGELVNRDETLAAGIPDFERQVNGLQLEIDEKAITLLATHQPVAGDLRLILMASRISGELERIGDLVINITENVATLIQQPQLKPLIDIPRMAEVASKMVHESLDAFLRSDVLLAQAVIMTDDRVDDLKEQILRELLTYMAADPKSIERAMALILISRHLERIADHATNIAEDVIYLIQGRDVRHPKTR
ncbi:MAG: phosphate signaling complex protein PhoU [Planctomycetota bacterium]|jgi:phosphate transport system protein